MGAHHFDRKTYFIPLISFHSYLSYCLIYLYGSKCENYYKLAHFERVVIMPSWSSLSTQLFSSQIHLSLGNKRLMVHLRPNGSHTPSTKVDMRCCWNEMDGWRVGNLQQPRSSLCAWTSVKKPAKGWAAEKAAVREARKKSRGRRGWKVQEYNFQGKKSSLACRSDLWVLGKDHQGLTNSACSWDVQMGETLARPGIKDSVILFSSTPRPLGELTSLQYQSFPAST